MRACGCSPRGMNVARGITARGCERNARQPITNSLHTVKKKFVEALESLELIRSRVRCEIVVDILARIYWTLDEYVLVFRSLCDV